MGSDRVPQPLDAVTWVSRDSLRPNDYNPNAVPPPELRLLKISILEDGWTQPIVVHRGTNVIVDGEHRWTVAADPEVAQQTAGLVPVVYVEGDLSHRMMSTIRHNRARGEHAVLPMAAIVRALLAAGCDKADVILLLQMEDEEVDRLAERAGMPEVVGRQGSAFNAGWVPG
jgi:ParB-like chromosome segregation protein Spo0J